MKKRLYRMISTLSEKTELPLNEICKEFTAAISGRREIIFDGVISIDKYEEKEIILALCGENVAIYGNMLELKSFYRTALCICGNIDKIEFGVEENR